MENERNEFDIGWIFWTFAISPFKSSKPYLQTFWLLMMTSYIQQLWDIKSWWILIFSGAWWIKALWQTYVTEHNSLGEHNFSMNGCDNEMSIIFIYETIRMCAKISIENAHTIKHKS